ncbi:hypothetical protein [Agrobacterium vitis]|nr:hypothetical protein [Agrobacterium vitis]
MKELQRTFVRHIWRTALYIHGTLYCARWQDGGYRHGMGASIEG